MNKRKNFDENWSDEIFDIEAINMPLILPDKTSKENNKIWVDKQVTADDVIFGKEHRYDGVRTETAILKPSIKEKLYTIRDSSGKVVEDIPELFPAKAWMSDSGQERCMMFASAKFAKGDVLVAGLGLAIYPQFVLALNRPVKSITIIENNQQIIDLIQTNWFKDEYRDKVKVTIINSDIEDFLAETKEKFDTIYLDTWEDADARFLAGVNYLISLSSNCIMDDGIIQAWGYDAMIKGLIKDIKALLEANFPLDDYNLDPVLDRFYTWFKEQKDEVSQKDIEEKAREFALTTKKSLKEYDRDKCFTGFATSIVEFYSNLALFRKTNK